MAKKLSTASTHQDNTFKKPFEFQHNRSTQKPISLKNELSYYKEFYWVNAHKIPLSFKGKATIEQVLVGKRLVNVNVTPNIIANYIMWYNLRYVYFIKHRWVPPWGHFHTRPPRQHFTEGGSNNVI